MIRKWMTTLLALLLAVMMPVCAMADKQHTLTVIPGQVLGANEAFVDLSEVLSLTYISGDESGAVSAALGEQDIVTFAASADTTGLYVYSNLLSDDVLYVTWEDGIAVLSQLASAEMGEEYAEVFQQSMEAQIAQLLQVGAAPTAAAFSPEESLEALRKIYGDDPAMIAYFEKIYSNMNVEEGTFSSAQRDTATGRIAANFTDEELVELCDTQFMRNMVEEVITVEDPELLGAALNEAVDAMLEEIRQIYRDMEMDGGMSVYTVDDGETIVGLEMDIPMTIKAEDETISFVMQMDYNRLTGDNGVSYKANFEMGIPDEEDGMISIVFDHYKGADELCTSEGMLALLAGGMQFTITYDATTTDHVRTRLAGVYARDGATAIIEPAASERPLISFQVVSKDADPAVLEKIEKADPDTAVNVLKLSEEGMNELLTGIQIRLIQIYSNVLSNVPASVLTLLMGTAE